MNIAPKMSESAVNLSLEAVGALCGELQAGQVQDTLRYNTTLNL